MHDACTDTYTQTPTLTTSRFRPLTPKQNRQAHPLPAAGLHRLAHHRGHFNRIPLIGRAQPPPLLLLLPGLRRPLPAPLPRRRGLGRAGGRAAVAAGAGAVGVSLFAVVPTAVAGAYILGREWGGGSKQRNKAENHSFIHPLTNFHPLHSSNN